jgi:uncharacterized damage-inducible protein DinB
MEMILDRYHTSFLNEIRKRLFDECQSRVHTCLDALTLEEIWHRPNENSNSVGNLVLHLCGNVHQWVLSTLGGRPDTRERQKEFDTREQLSAASLKKQLDTVLGEVNTCLNQVTADDLIKSYTVQGFDETGIGILIHVTEHFSYHVGQMTYFVKAHKDRDIGYYKGQNLDAVN